MNARARPAQTGPVAAESSALHSSEAEQSALGALLNVGRVVIEEQRYASLLNPSDFYLTAHRSIFSAILALLADQQSIDLVTVSERLAKTDPEQLQEMGGLAYLGTLAQFCPSPGNFPAYARIVRERSLTRRAAALFSAGERELKEAHGRQVGQILIELRRALDDLWMREAMTAGIRAYSAKELVRLPTSELQPLLSPWLYEKCLCMVHAKRGVGKTQFAIGVALAAARGQSFLGWEAPAPREVLYVDGEMPVQVLQQRLSDQSGGEAQLPDGLRIVTPDTQDGPMPDLATTEGQAQVDSLVTANTALIVIDNLSCLVRSGGAENESESWTLVSEWALRHRRLGRAVMFIHHSGKTGAQRGTSKREDILDVVINLRRPSDYREEDGAVFNVVFEKARSLMGDEVSPIEARLGVDAEGALAWTWRAVASVTHGQIQELWDLGGVSITDIARELEINKSTVSRALQKAMQEGKLKRPYPSRRSGAMK